MNKTTVGTRLLRLRNGRDLSLRALEEMTGINKSTLHKWETDRATPTREGLQVLSELYNVQASWLLFGREKAPDSSDEMHDLIEQFTVLSPQSKKTVQHVINHLVSLESKQGERNGT